MTSHHCGCLIVVALAIQSATVWADSQVWLEAGVSLTPTKRVEINIVPSVRFDQDVSRFQSFLPELSVRYRVKKWLRVGSGYRFEYERNKDGDLVVRHRVTADARLRATPGPLRLDHRLMLVEQFRPASKDQYRTFVRNAITVSYRQARPWVPAVSAEVFHALGDLDQLAYDRLRLTAALAHVREKDAIEVFLRLQVHADPMAESLYIIGLGSSFEL